MHNIMLPKGCSMNSRKPTIIVYTLLLGSLLSVRTNKAEEKQPETWITVFVHGIMSVAPHLNLHNFALLMADDIVDTIYARTVNLMRQDPFFYINQAMQGFGIKQLDPNDIKEGKASNAIARMYDDITHLVTPEQVNNYYYTYGWSGLLSISQRCQEAEGLLIAINQLVEKFKIVGINPKVRVIGYSHGGNVSLNIACIHKEKYPTMDFSVDELILIGTPVQVETDYLINSPIFKEIYHIYSTVDRIQQIDFFSSNRFFSDRIFKTRRNLKLPDKLTQVNMKISRLRSTSYDKQMQFVRARDFNTLSNISGQRRLWRDASPGHIELWFLGWIPGKYRPHFPLNPLPALITVPFIISEIKKVKGTLKPYPVIIDMRPELEVALIKQRKRNHFVKVVPFIPNTTLEKLKTYASAVKPQEYGSALYKQHIADALKEAHKQFGIQKKENHATCGPRKRRHRFRRKRSEAPAVDRSYRFNEAVE